MPAGSARIGRNVPVRIFTLVFGLLAVGWGATGFPVFWRQSSIERIATLILMNYPFKIETLAQQAPSLDAIERAVQCRPGGLHAAAIVQVRMAEDVTAEARRELIDPYMRAERDSIRRSLACSPADPFLWLVLFGAESAQNGFHPAQLNYLRMSYLLGPNEGWIGVKRNHIALALFEQLPPDIAEMAISEFVKLVVTGLYDDAVAILTGPGWRFRDVLLPRLKEVAEGNRRAFAWILYAQGYDVAVPGITFPEREPWR